MSDITGADVAPVLSVPPPGLPNGEGVGSRAFSAVCAATLWP